MILKNKVVLITGSANGIGKAAALEFAKHGAKIVVNYKQDLTSAQKTVGEIERLGSEAILIKSDVSKPKEVKNLFATTIKQFGTVDILINNAGLAKPKEFLKITRDDLIEEFDENFFGMVYCAQEAAKIMLKNKSGKIINVSSICGLTGCTSVLTFTSARSALTGFTKALAKLLAPKITVNAVAPGYTSTRYWNTISEDTKKQVIEETLLKKWVTPEEIADTYLYLAKNDSITGQVIIVDGGYTTNI